jgi:Tetracyclin repressor-like, C-terminal domain
MSIRWRPPAVGALRADLCGLLGTFRDQLANPLIARIAPGLLAEASHDGALAEVIYAEAAAHADQRH